jgi:hypothetical protein
MKLRRLLPAAAALLAAAIAVALGSSSGTAATPSSGTIGPTATSVTWQSPFYPASATAISTANGSTGTNPCPPPEADPLSLVCDQFMLTVDVPPTYWDTHSGGVQIKVEWPNNGVDDFDLFVYNQDGNEVAKDAGGNDPELAFVPNATGAYDVVVIPFTVVATQFTATATFISNDGGGILPARTSGGISFGPSTVVDFQRTEGEPINYIDRAGHDWVSGPFGTSTQLSFIQRSNDGGDQFNVVSPLGIRPTPPPGGGDTDIAVDDQGYDYFTDLEGLVKIEASVSNDDGQTWRKNPAAEATTVDDRQWFAIDNGATSAATDNTIFLAYRNETGAFILSSPGSTGAADPVGGLVYQNAATSATALTSGQRCGQLRFDPVKRDLYLPCFKADHVDLVHGPVNPGQRTGIAFTATELPGSPGHGAVDNLFPLVATDAAGNVYATWSDTADNNIYYTYSTDEGNTWAAPVLVNGGEARSNVMPWMQADAAGRVAIVWYGSPFRVDSDLMPSWFNNRQAASQYPWYGYVALLQNAASPTPTIYQTTFTEHPMHYGQICTGGIGCTVTGGDRSMADFFSVYFDSEGAMRIAYNDTTNHHHGAIVYEARQLAGPGGLAASVSHAAPANPAADPTGDAQSPHYAPATGPGASLPQFDFTQLALSQPNASTLRVRMTLKSLASLAPPAGKTSGFWMTRFQALSVGDQGEEAYRLFYVGAESQNGGPLQFFAGSGTSAQTNVPGNGCITNTPQNCKILEYPREVTATGSVSGNTITIDVPIEGGFGADRPINGATLYSVIAFSGGRNDATTDVYADLDSTRSFDYVIGSSIIPPPPSGSRTVTGGGSIAGTASDARFALNPDQRLHGKVSYVDDGAALTFKSTRITSLTFDDATHRATVKGTGVAAGQQVDFTVTVTDASVDTFSISLSSGYKRGGPLTKGNVTIH